MSKGEKTREKIINTIKESRFKECSLEAIANKINTSRGLIVYHAGVLEKEGKITKERRGRFCFYKLANGGGA